MTNFESIEPDNEGFTDRYDAEPYTREHLNAAIDLVDKVSDLASALRSDRMADQSQYDFMFDGDKLQKMYLPDTVQAAQALYGQLDEIAIQLEHDGGSPTSSISFRLHYIDDDGKRTLLKVERPGHYKQTMSNSNDHLYELGQRSTYREVQSIPYQDLNKMTASLIFPPSKCGDLSIFDSLDLNDGTIYEALVAALQKHTSHYVGQEYYELHTTPGSFSYVIDDGELISADLVQTKHSDIIMDGDMPVSVSRSLSTEIDLTSGLTLMFSRVTEFGENIERDVFAPELTDYMITSEFIDYHMQRAHPIETERLNELTLPSQQALPGKE